MWRIDNVQITGCAELRHGAHCGCLNLSIDSGKSLTHCEFSSRGYLHSAFHSCGMFDQAQVHSSSREQAACEHGNEFSNLAHCSILASLDSHPATFTRHSQRRRRLFSEA